MTKFIEEHLLREIRVVAKTPLLKEGETAQKMFFIKKGSVRVWFNNNGKDITTQFFFEGDMATSLESFIYGEPSPFTIETMEDCQLAVFNKNEFDKLLAKEQAFKDWFYQTALQKLFSHSKRLLSFIKNKPHARYRELIEQQPHILRRVPQHCIASYLGITSVSLSRIRNRK
jgi:CRP-like cAMP-binding protein